jgi:medium-chain acyl-[acyl-carrier-protein] hydrolase
VEFIKYSKGQVRNKLNTLIPYDRWFIRHRPNRSPKIRLFCFPFGGGGASFFRTWIDYLPPQIELCAVQIPGREHRLREPLFTELLPLVNTISKVVQPYIDTPFVFFGHSMGAWIGYELARQLRSQGHPIPLHLFVSGRKAPHIPNQEAPKHNLPEPEFIKEINRYNGTPDLVLQDPELLGIFLPILRADFSILETYDYEHQDPIACSVTAFGGLQDDAVSRKDIEAWQLHTSKEFRSQMFNGGHFFLKDSQAQVLSEINSDISKFL